MNWLLRLGARAFEIYEKISPLKKTDPETLAVYGLIPTQQPADIYDGWGHGGRGGWSWYTGSAARMLSAAYALLGVGQQDGPNRIARRPVRGQGGTEGPVSAHRREDVDRGREGLNGQITQSSRAIRLLRAGLAPHLP